jgi:ribonuclease BN (tRNA processing enzyme)
VKIRILGAHNCESANSKMVSLLVDDILAIDAGSLTSSLSFECQAKLKAILLTHAHYDHVRDIPAVALNLFSLGKTIIIYSTKNTRDVISGSLLNGEIYPDFTRLPETRPAVRFSNIEPYKPYDIEGFSVIAVPVNHGDVAVGYQVMSPEGRKVFFAADTGLGLTGCWDYVSPELLLIEVTFPNRLKESALNSKHLTPMMLESELTYFRQAKGYLPSVVVVHMDPKVEQEIKDEIEEVSKNHNIPISLAYEGMELML